MGRVLWSNMAPWPERPWGRKDLYLAIATMGPSPFVSVGQKRNTWLGEKVNPLEEGIAWEGNSEAQDGAQTYRGRGGALCKGLTHGLLPPLLRGLPSPSCP